MGVAYAHGVLDYLGIKVKAAESTTTETNSQDVMCYVQIFAGSRKGAEIKLKEAKEAVDGAPKVLKEGVGKEDAEAIKAKLEEVGAKVTLK